VWRHTARGCSSPYREDVAYYEGRAVGLLASAEDGTESALAPFRRWDAPLTPQGARSVVAREHGFSSWAVLRRHVTAMRDHSEPFARAYRLLEAQDMDGLREQLDRFPDLVAAGGTNGNDLLGMAAATCDERLVALLLERGADPARTNAHGWTPLHRPRTAAFRSSQGSFWTPGRRPTFRRAATAARRSSSRSSGVTVRWPSSSPGGASSRATCAPPPASGGSI
jgi:hypothetical protein